jgi:hypothetical protein
MIERIKRFIGKLLNRLTETPEEKERRLSLIGLNNRMYVQDVVMGEGLMPSQSDILKILKDTNPKWNEETGGAEYRMKGSKDAR